jgi:hypothetical protein
MRSPLISVAVLMALAAAPASAQDPDVPQTQIELGSVVSDVQATHLHAPVKCVQPTGTAGACVLTLRVSWQRTPKTKWAPSGPRTVVDEQQLTIPVGETREVRSSVAPGKLRDVLSAADGAAIVTFAFSDPAGEVDSSGTFVAPPSRKGGCSGDVFFDVLGGTLDEKTTVNGKDHWNALEGAEIARSTPYRVTSASAVVRYSGIRVTAAKGSEFLISCAALSDYNQRRFFPAVYLLKGKVRLQGRPQGRGAFAVAVDTLEGNLGMRRGESADLTVTRNPRRSVSTMHVHKGRSGQITPTFHTAQSSPCTSGSKLSVNLRGRIRRVR